MTVTSSLVPRFSNLFNAYTRKEDSLASMSDVAGMVINEQQSNLSESTYLSKNNDCFQWIVMVDRYFTVSILRCSNYQCVVLINVFLRSTPTYQLPTRSTPIRSTSHKINCIIISNPWVRVQRQLLPVTSQVVSKGTGVVATQLLSSWKVQNFHWCLTVFGSSLQNSMIPVHLIYPIVYNHAK